jgi:hypothetical protein
LDSDPTQFLRRRPFTDQFLRPPKKVLTFSTPHGVVNTSGQYLRRSGEPFNDSFAKRESKGLW